MLFRSRPASPAIGSVEYFTGTTVITAGEITRPTVTVIERSVFFTGLEGEQLLTVYTANGQLTGQYRISDNESVQLRHTGLMLMRIQNSSFKVLVQ